MCSFRNLATTRSVVDRGQGQATVGAAFYSPSLRSMGTPVSGIPVLTDNLTVTTGSGVNGGEYTDLLTTAPR